MSADTNPSELPIVAWMKWAHEHGIWEMINILVLVVSALIGFTVLFWAKRRVRNLNFFVQRLRDASNFPLKVCVEIRNVPRLVTDARL